MQNNQTNNFEKILEEFLDKAVEIHRNTVVADGHSDFPYRAVMNDADIISGKNCNQLSVKQMLRVNHRIQGAAAYTPAEYSGESATNFAKNIFIHLINTVERNPEILEIITSKNQLLPFAENKSKTIGLLLWLESVSPIAGSIKIAEDFAKLGVKGACLVHNVENEAAHG